MSHTFTTKDSPATGITINICENGEEIGLCVVYVIENPNRGKKWALLEDVMINANNRANGAGTELVNKAIEVAKESGCYKMMATSRFERENVHRFYEKIGFQKHGFGFRLNFEVVDPQL